MNKVVKFIFDSDIIKKGILIEDPLFDGGYKIVSGDKIFSILVVKIIEKV